MKGHMGKGWMNRNTKRRIAAWMIMVLLLGGVLPPESIAVQAQSTATAQKEKSVSATGSTVTGSEDSSESPASTESTAPTESVAPTESAVPTGSVVPTESTAPTESVAPTESAEPTATVKPTTHPTAKPTVKPTPKPKAYVLLSPKATYKKGKQKGIHYKKVKGKKVYHISSYTTDTVTLSMSQASTFRVYGGGSAREVKNKYVTVNSKGLVRCRARGKGQEVYTIIEAVSNKTKQKQYIYIKFREKLYCTSGTKISLYERYSSQLKFNYGRKKLSFSISNKKKATVNSKGKVNGISHGTVTLTVRVKDSQKNEIKIKIIVKIEPWIVDQKNKCYDYGDMTKDLKKLSSRYPTRARLSSIGTTADEREIWCMRVGKADAEHKLIINAAIHAREWKNVQVVMRQMEEILREYKDFKERFKNTAIYIVPMDNPDGVTIAQHGFKAIRNKKLQKRCKKIGHADVWKANARGVDLNDNFPAGFSKKRKGYKKKPSYMAYPGKKAASERETRALMALVNNVEPDAVLNIHSTGSILYWDFDVEGDQHDELGRLAEKIHSFNKYTLMPKSSSTTAAGGYADWINYKKNIISITVETGVGACPLDHSEYKTIYKKNNKMFRWFMTRYVAYEKDEKDSTK